MEGDAIPFLIDQVEAKRPRLSNVRAEIGRRLPSRLGSLFPAPQHDTNAILRRQIALDVLGKIGERQQVLLETGKPSRKRNISVAIPTIDTALKSSEFYIRDPAAVCARSIGPEAAHLVPQLIHNAGHSNGSPGMAIMALGAIGSAASNAVPTLIQIVLDPARETDQHTALAALSEIGPSARNAIPILSSLLTRRDGHWAGSAARAIAEIGYTPDEAVPALIKLRREEQGAVRSFATLALWNWDHTDTNYAAQIISALHSKNEYDKIFMLTSFRRLGTNAAPFAEEVRRLVSDPDPTVSALAERAMRKIQPISR